MLRKYMKVCQWLRRSEKVCKMLRKYEKVSRILKNENKQYKSQIFKNHNMNFFFYIFIIKIGQKMAQNVQMAKIFYFWKTVSKRTNGNPTMD